MNWLKGILRNPFKDAPENEEEEEKAKDPMAILKAKNKAK